MVDDQWKGRKINAAEVAQLYHEIPHQWMLLEVLSTKNGKAEWFYLLKHAKDKEELYDYLMDEDENWDSTKKYIFVYADPDDICKI